MEITPGSSIGSWNSLFGKADLTVTKKLKDNINSKEEADSFAKSIHKQAAVINNKDGSYSVFEVDDGAIFDDFSKSDKINILAKIPGSSEAVVNLFDEEGNEVIDDKDNLRKLANSNKPSDRLMVAQNPSSPIDLLRKLSKDSDVSIRKELSKNPRITSDIVDTLSKDSNVEILRNIASNKNITQDTAKALASSPDNKVKEKIAGNNNTPRSILKQLSSDTNDSVRIKVASNKNTDFQTLRDLLKDKNEVVRNSAQNILKVTYKQEHIEGAEIGGNGGAMR